MATIKEISGQGSPAFAKEIRAMADEQLIAQQLVQQGDAREEWYGQEDLESHVRGRQSSHVLKGDRLRRQPHDKGRSTAKRGEGRWQWDRMARVG